MGSRKITVTAMAFTALILFPLAGSALALTFFNMSGLNVSGTANVIKGTATLQFITSDGKKKTTTTTALTNGSLSAGSNFLTLAFDDTDLTADFSATVFFASKDSKVLPAGTPAEVDIYTNSAAPAGNGGLLHVGNSVQGPASVDITFPSDDFIAANSGAGRQWFVNAAARLTGAFSPKKKTNTGKAVMRAASIVPYKVGYTNYTSFGTGNIADVHFGITVYTDGKAALPSAPLGFHSYSIPL